VSDYKPNIFVNFINRRKNSSLTEMPIVNRLTVNKDIRQLCDSFDFDVQFRFGSKIDLRSHDFVEFYTLINGQKFQVACGFLEDFTKDTSNNTHSFKANGRDFLGQLLSLPFLTAKPLDQTNLANFVNACLEGSYLLEYLNIKGVGRSVVDLGSYKGPVNVPELSSAKRGPVLQQTADEVFNLVYQNRFGQVVIWGRESLNAFDTGFTLNETKDENVVKFTIRENFSKVFSQVKLFYTGGEGNIDYKLTPSKELFNSEPKARQLFQPEVRTFQSGTLVTTAGGADNNYEVKKDQLAASILRKSNQNLTQVVIKANRPFYTTPSGEKVAYEINQLWGIKSQSFDLNEKMRLVGISYSQSNSDLDVELLFIGKDTLT
jgi:hypothetical protein